MRHPSFVRYLVLLFAFAASLAAQTGSVRSGGQPIPGATVTANVEGKTFTTVTGPDGHFAFTDLPGGKGTIEVSMFGFVPVSKPAVLGPLGPVVDFTLQLAQSQAARRMGQYGARAGQTDTAETQLQNEINSAQTPTSEPGASPAAAGGNEAFLVSGSLSQGLAQNAPADSAFLPPPGVGGPGGPGGGSFGQAIGGGGGGGFGGGGGGFGGGGGGGRGGGGGGFGGGGGGFGPNGRNGQRGQGGPAQFGNRRRQASAVHGMVFFTLDNSSLDAKPFSISGSDLVQPAYAQSRFGLIIGGPLTIPKLFKDPNTTFAITYFGTRAKNPQVNFSTVPTLAERGGDFQDAVQATGTNQTLAPVTIYMPGGTTPFPQNTIPSSMLSPQALALLSYIPGPNAPGLVNNYFYDAAAIANTDNLNVRLNRNITKADRLAYHIAYQDRNGQNVQPFGFTDLTNGYGITTDLTWTRTISPHLISNARVQFSRNINKTLPYFAGKPDVADIPNPSTNPLNDGPPNLNFTNFASLSDSNPVLTRNQSQNGSESMIVIHGTHSFTLGMQYQRNDLSTQTDQNGRGTFNFTGLATSALTASPTTGALQPVPDTGYDFADFLLGYAQSNSIRYGDTNTYFSQNVWTGYVNDDWKVNSQLTFTPGIRWEYFSPFSEKYNQMANLDIAPGFTSVAVVTPNMPGPYTGAFPSGLLNSQYNNFSPRVGVAWKVPHIKKSTIIRSGYGIYYNTQAYQPFALQLAEQPPFAIASYSLNGTATNPIQLADGFCTPSQNATNSCPSSQEVTNTYAVDRFYKIPYAQTWNFSVQNELVHGIVSEIGYTGTKGTHLNVAMLPNESAEGVTQKNQLGDAVGFTYNSPVGNSIYNGLTVRVQQRFRGGISWQLHYAYSRSIDDSSTFGGVGNTVAQNWLDLAAERGLSSFNRAQVLTGNWTFTSPIGGPQSRFASDSLTGRLLKDWQLAGSITAETGTPLTARVLGNASELAQTSGVGSERADATGAPIQSGSGFFNPAAFAVPLPGTFGNAGRNTIPGPDLVSVNLSFGRSFKLDESRRRLEVRFETTNSLNQVNFTNVNTIVNSITYGAPLATSAMRSASIVARFRF